ncbi:MAG: hypothetical protein HRU33_02210 [Rhodobacteraceae bacterium]|nr:hypothetical protein [Paracoccaceae bacterium]
MRLFRRDEQGFVLVLALLVMPIFIGFAFVIIDIGRGNNAHADLVAAADAVAKSVSAICDIPPLYICNPFEFDDSGSYVDDELQTRFAQGDLHGRMIRLHPKGNQTHAPGNFGFLSVNGNSSADAIRDFFAGNRNPTCVATDTVTTKPGAATAISQGINTRFDIYQGPFSNWRNASRPFVIGPALNVRKGIRPDFAVHGPNVRIDDCVGQGSSGTPGDGHLNDVAAGWDANATNVYVYGLADNGAMAAPNMGIPGRRLAPVTGRSTADGGGDY